MAQVTAVIAGTGNLPHEACKRLMSAGSDFFVVSLFPEDNGQQLASILQVNQLISQALYKPSAILDLLKARHTSHVVFVGKVDKSNLLKKLSFDWLALKIMGSLVTRGDKDVMEALLAELARHGIQTLRQDHILGGLLVKPGVLCGELSPELETNINLGLATVLALSQADIGQTVVIKDAMVLAVEAIEGTDACIRRGLGLAQRHQPDLPANLVICKGAHPAQNPRFDLPTLGVGSLQNFQPGDIQAIAWLAQTTLIADGEALIMRAQKLGITLIAVDALTVKKP